MASVIRYASPTRGHDLLRPFAAWRHHGRYFTKSGQRSARRLNSSAAIDPERTKLIFTLLGPKKPSQVTCAQIWEDIRPTSHAAIAQPAPAKKPTQNQTPIR